MTPLAEVLTQVVHAENECKAANVDENDYTVFTTADLEFELELVVQSVAKKIAFIDNQVSADVFACSHAEYTSIDRVPEHDEPHTGATRAVREYIQIL